MYNRWCYKNLFMKFPSRLRENNRLHIITNQNTGFPPLRFVFAQYKQHTAEVLDIDITCNRIIKHIYSSIIHTGTYAQRKGVVPMKEKDLRRYHRITGVVLAVFIIVQAGTGLIFTIGKIAGSSGGHDHSTANISIFPISKAQAAASSEPEAVRAHESENILSILHYGGGIIGNIYRLLLAVTIIGQVSGGLLIYMRIKARKKAKN
jgi:hypothetical protein